MNTETSQPHTIVSLLQSLRDETTTLLRQEVALAKAELKDNASKMSKHAVAITAGTFVAYAGVIVLLIGLGHLLAVGLIRAGIDPEMAQWLAPTLVGVLVAVIGWSMLAKAKRAFSSDSFTPRKTIASLKTNAQWAQNKLQHSHESTI
jgi:hypothetical protein